MIKKITAFSSHQTGVGEQIAFTYSEIEESGKIINQNKRAEVVVLDQNIIHALESVYEFLQTKIPE